MLRTRFAPSPTGHLHLGGARTAILNWLLARRHGGEFVLRIEDTDVERNVAGAEDLILDDLRWLGLDWDEGPQRGGAHGPYRQSERSAVYAESAQRLLASGHAYPCTCPPQVDDAAHGRRRCPCADRPQEGDVPDRASLRLRVPDAEVVVPDLVRGEVRFPAGSVEDFVLLRSDGRPTYNFAAAVDDAAMRITHVVRGVDHLTNAPKQLLLFRALQHPEPHFAHIPLILGPDRQKLSKRHGATSVAEYRRRGYLAEALVNYLSLLSWSSASGEEFLPPERLIAEVEMARVGSSDAVFDPDKLRWLSGRYVQELALSELLGRLQPFLPADLPIEPERLPVAVDVVRPRFALLTEAAETLESLLGPTTAGQRAAREAALADPVATPVLAAVRAALATVEPWEETAINGAVREAGRAAGARGRALFHPLRLALTGEDRGPELARILFVLGRERALRLLAPARDLV